MPLKIVKYPAKVLRQKAKKVKDPLAPETQKLVAEMFSAMRQDKGLGLAAPQVGQSLRIFIVEIPASENEPAESYVFINPKITAYSKEKIKMEEGCLSFPGKFFEISRPSSVKIRYLDEKGKKIKMKIDGILARAIQHEIDHLDGILIIDKK